MAKTIYLDYAAATPLDERVFAAMKPFFSDQFYNPSSPYAAAKQVKTAYLKAKADIAAHLAVKPNEIIITAGATESVNLAIRGLLAGLPDVHVVSSAIEHQAVLSCVKHFPHTLTAVKSSGEIDLAALKKSITDATVLVTVGYANSELGTVQPLKKIAEIINLERQRRLKNGNTRPIYFHTDASQAVGQLNLQPNRLGVDLMSFGAAKCYGPKQVGVLWARPTINLEPIIYGGGQERNLRSGTENVAGAVGLAAALKFAEQLKNKEVKRLGSLRDELESIVVSALPATVIVNAKAPRLANFSHLAWPSVDAERLLIALDLEGIMVATGAACAANKGTRSHVLKAIGLNLAIADGSLRLSLGRHTTRSDIKIVAGKLINLINKESSK